MIELRSRRLHAAILPRGATLCGLWVEGNRHSLVLGAPDATDYPHHLTYFGAVVGPVANRISRAEVTIDGQHWRMEANEGSNCLHSGAGGLHATAWHTVDTGPAHVVLATTLEHRSGGLPGKRDIRARYELVGDTVLRLELTATSDRPTVMNLAHHPYWNLDGAPSIAGHQLRVDAEDYLPVNAETLPTGSPRPVAGSAYDFRTPRAVPTGETLDANLCLSRNRQPDPRPVAALTAGGIRLDIHTTEPGLQVYNGTGLGPTAAHPHDDRILAPCAGIALEPQAWPDAPHHPNYPSILLLKNERYRQITEYHISA